MIMRKLKRAIARARMRDAGIGNMNRKHIVKVKGGGFKNASFFGLNWRKWVSGNPLKKSRRK